MAKSFWLLSVLLWHFALGDSYWSLQPATTAAGEIPPYAVLTFDVMAGTTAFGTKPSTFVFTGTTVVPTPLDLLDVTYSTGLRCEIDGCVNTNIDKWTPWNRYAPVPWLSDTAAINPTVGQAAAAGKGTGVYTVMSDTGITFLPWFPAADGNVLRLYVYEVVAKMPLQSATAPTTPDYPIRVFLPWFLLASNPEFPGFRVYTTLTVTVNNKANAPMGVLNPWTTTNPETELSQLQYISLIPGDVSGKTNVPNTIASTALSSLTFTFHPGVQLGANHVVTVFLHGGNAIVSAIPSSPTTPLPTVAIGPNCGVSPNSLFCCSASTVLTTIPPALGTQVLAGDAWGSTAYPHNSQLGWSSIQFTLLPAGCVLPADKRITFSVSAPYVGTNPAIANIKADNSAAANSIGYRHVDSYVATSAEPLPVMVQRYSSSWAWSPLLIDWANTAAPVVGFQSTGTATLGATASLVSGTVPTLAFGFGPGSYVVGATQLTGFTATPDTLLTNLIPNVLTFSFTTNGAITLGATVGTMTVPGFVITSNQGIFRPNVGSPLSLTPIASLGVKPTSCTAAGAFTDSWGTLYVLPWGNNVANTASCTIGATTAVQFGIPSQMLLPNPATGSVVTFDIRVMPSITQSTGIAATSTTLGDTAALMNQPGYTTIAVCATGSAPSYTAGAVNDLNSLAYASRCALVNGISAISPVTAGIMQCPPGATVTNAGNLVTFTKIPEGLWSTNVWPLTNYAANGAWSQSVGLSGSPPVYITSWGHMFSTPMYAVTVSYPPNTNSLTALSITSTVPSTYQLAFIVKMNRLTMFCSNADTLNPWTFQVGTCLPVSLVYAYTTVGSAGVPVQSITGSSWGTGNCMVFVTLYQGGAVVGWYSTSASPTSGSNSDDALFGLLALIAIPLLLCCCLLWALWYFRPRAEPPCPCPMAPEYPVQEMYWVNPQPVVAPVAAYPQAVPLSAPPTTPIYLVQ